LGFFVFAPLVVVHCQHIVNWKFCKFSNAEDVHALNAWIEQYPQSNISQIRQLIRNSIKETQHNKPAKSSRVLFKVLRENIEDTPE